MRIADALGASGPSEHRREVTFEQNQYYTASLVKAPDRWLWDTIVSGDAKTFELELSHVAPAAAVTIHVAIQGASDLEAAPDHHVELRLNGVLLGNAFWDGKTLHSWTLDVPTGVLRNGVNNLEVKNVGDTEASYSVVMLDRVSVSYGATPSPDGFWTDGTARVPSGGTAAHVVAESDSETLWVTPSVANGDVVFPSARGLRYLVVEEGSVLVPRVERVRAHRLLKRTRGVEYLAIGPPEFLDAAKPLLDERRRQGLRTRAVSIDDLFSEFGHGERNPAAIRDFLTSVYGSRRGPRLRYVVLVGDGTYDYKNVFGLEDKNPVPPYLVKTRYLWTVSDPVLAAVHGTDALPDVAIGRLPARTVEDVRTLVDKILAYESGGASRGAVWLVADNPDGAGDFRADAESLASGVLAPFAPQRIHLADMDPASAREAIGRAFDDGAALMSYLGHGGIHLWADENVLDLEGVASLGAQSKQPVLLAMNCLNGFFHFPFFDSLSEALVKAPGRGAIAAISSSGLSLHAPARIYHEAIVEELVNGGNARLGDAFLAAQKRYATSGADPELLLLYNLLGDPALRLPR